jgi:hypothetical protein
MRWLFALPLVLVGVDRSARHKNLEYGPRRRSRQQQHLFAIHPFENENTKPVVIPTTTRSLVFRRQRFPTIGKRKNPRHHRKGRVVAELTILTPKGLLCESRRLRKQNSGNNPVGHRRKTLGTLPERGVAERRYLSRTTIRSTTTVRMMVFASRKRNSTKIISISIDRRRRMPMSVVKKRQGRLQESPILQPLHPKSQEIPPRTKQ